MPVIRITLRLVATLALALPFAPASAMAATAQAAAPDATACARLAAASFGLPPENSVSIGEAKAIVAAAGMVCRVRGYVAPNTGFEFVLPLAGWNGKFFYAGCTGSCGIAADSIWARECDYPVSRGYACIISDMGHRGTPGDGLWAWRNLEAKLDFAYRATHRTALAGKAIATALYGTSPRYSYFMGCSTGGRQALVSAQRFPQDFDGIVAGAPVVSEAGTAMSYVWSMQSLNRRDGTPIFDDRSLAILHRGALAAFNAPDGVIADPRRGFDPATLRCRAGRKGDCLTDEQIDAARKVYRGPTDSRDRPTYFGGGFLPGSERYWRSFLALGGPPSATRSGTDTTRYIQTDFGPDWLARDMNFDRDPDRLREYEVLYSASNPDLRAFRDRGGKLLIYHGWADPRVAPGNSTDYYSAVTRAMGGAVATREFARLVMVPGMEHCWGGAGPYAIDYIAAMEAWVERGQAPETLRAARRTMSPNAVDLPTFIHPFPARGGSDSDTISLPVFDIEVAERDTVNLTPTRSLDDAPRSSRAGS